MRKWIIGFVVVGILLIWWLLRPQAIPVDVVTLQTAEMAATVEEQGRTRARLPHIITAPVAGHLLRHEWLEGQRVEAGQELAQLALLADDTRTEAGYRANLAAAEARRHSAEASLEEAESALTRAQRESERRDYLFRDRLIGEEERDRYRQELQAAEARTLSARSALAAAQADEGSARALLMGSDGETSADAMIRITAPVSGTLQQIPQREGVVAAGAPLFQLSNADALELVIDLLTQEAVKVSPGDEIRVTGWGGDDTLFGTVDYIEPEAFTKYSALGVEEQRVNVIGTLSAPATTPSAGYRIGAGYRIEAAIVVWRGDDVIAVPGSALLREAGQWHVFVVEDSRAHLRPVTIGESNREQTQVVDGLSGGDQVIVFPSDQVTDGVRVE